MEEYKMINGFEGLYSVSNLGRVFSHTSNKVLAVRLDGVGYPTVGLSGNGKKKNYSTHRLVALAFIKGYAPGLVVNHIDEDKQNNKANNLEWCSYKQNTKHSNNLRNQEIIKKYGNP